jgi:xanthine dehydrogenase YagR molybdenum-binding subunit
MAQQAPPKDPGPTVKHTVKVGHASNPQTLEVSAAEGDLKPWDLDSKLRAVGGRHTRLDGPLKVTGKAKYTFDIQVPGMLWAKMVRASVPAAEIVKIDTSKAEALPGVKAVWTTESRTVRFAGQDVAAVAATALEIAEDAARLVEVTYDEKAYVTDLRKAMEADVPTVYAAHEIPGPPTVTKKGNIVGPNPNQRNRGDVEKALSEAAVTLEETYSLPVHTHAPLETHGVIAAWTGDQLKIYASTQGTFTVRDGVADALKIDRKNVEVVVEHMGGGFGSKLAPSATGSAFAVVACRLAKQAGAPVKLMLDRREEHLCTGNAPSALMTVRLGASRDGTLSAIHHRSFGGPGIAGGAGTGGPAGVLYQNCPNLKIEDHAVFTNAGPQAPLRAPGWPQGAFALESAIDELAHKLGMDPLEFRRKNESSPVRKVQYDIGAKAIGWERRNKKPGVVETTTTTSGNGNGSGLPGSASSKRRGIGMANGGWNVNAREDTGAEVRIHRDGSVELFTGAQDIGTGFRTAMAIVVAEELGLKPADVTPRIGNSAYPFGPASGGSNTTNSVAPVVRLAAADARQKLFEVTAPLLKAQPADLDAADGKIFVKTQPSKSVTFKQAAAKMTGEVITALAQRKKNYQRYRDDIAGTQFCEVEVDVETGNVRVLKMVSVNDCGIPINALTSESQVIGAMIQGASWALFENRILDRNVGTMVNANLESYKILTPADMFEAVSILTPVANAGQNTSSAGLGEPPIVPTLAAVANAVFNATGARVRSLPITPDVMLAALAEAKRRA